MRFLLPLPPGEGRGEGVGHPRHRRRGQLASALAARGGNVVVGRPAFDFDRPDTLLDAVRAAAPRVVVNAAAYTAVDRAESEPDAAMRANRDGPAMLARYCADALIPLIHVSTDYVFDGDKGAPYVETDRAQSHRRLWRDQAGRRTGGAGRVSARDRAAHRVGVRPAREELRADHAERREEGRSRCAWSPTRSATRPPPTIWPLPLGHSPRASLANGATSGPASITRPAAARRVGTASPTAVFEDAAARGLPRAVVDAIATTDWPTPARRPADSRLDCGKLERVFGLRLPHWRDGVARTVAAVAAA